MGYYIESNRGSFGKADYLVEELGGFEVTQNEAAEYMKDLEKGVIVVCENQMFEAAGFAFDEREFKAFTLATDDRPKRFVVLDRGVAIKESGYIERE